MKELTKLEFSILEKLSIKYPYIKNHISYLEVSSRELTGVGMYINFAYKNLDKIKKITPPSTSISTNEIISIDALEFGLGYEVDITDGLIKFIELVTYGEEWDGSNTDNFSFS